MTETIRYTQTETGKPSKPSSPPNFSGDYANGDAMGSVRHQISIEELLVWAYRHHRAHAISADQQSLNGVEPRVAALAMSAMSTALAVSEALAISADDPDSVPGNQYAARKEVMPQDARLVHNAVMALPEESRNRVILQATRGERPSDGNDVADHEWVPIYARDGKRVEWHSGEYNEVAEPPQGLKPGEGYWLLVPCPRTYLRTGWLVRRARRTPYSSLDKSKRRRYLAVRYVDRSSRVAAAKHRYKLWWDALVAVRWFVAPLLDAHELTDALPPHSRCKSLKCNDCHVWPFAPPAFRTDVL